MKTTLDIPDDLFREAKARAALAGMKLKDLVAEGLRLRLASGEQLQTTSGKQRPLLESLDALPLIKGRSAGCLEITSQSVHELEMTAELERHAASVR